MSADLLNPAVLAPLGFAGIGAMVVLMGEVILSRAKSFVGREVNDRFIGAVLAFAAIFFLGIALIVSVQWFSGGQSTAFNPLRPMFQLDPFSSLATALISLAALLSCALAVYYLEELHINHGEYYALLLLSVCGMMMLVSSVDFLTLFVGLELMSIPIYVLAGFDRRRLRSNESAMKYFLIGSFASAVMLYGIALLYGVAGSTSFDAVRAALDPNSTMAMVGMALVFVGFSFKIAAVPFHQWVPDVYEGAPAAVTAFMSVAVKAAAVAGLLRVSGMAFGPQVDALREVLWVLAALTMVVGNVMAVIQENVKRLLAYSSVAHAGYILMGLVAGSPEGYAAIVFYLIAYTFMNLGAFAVVVALSNEGHDCEQISSFAGLARRRPTLAALMALFMVSLIGIPPTAGFFAKFGIFVAAVNAGQVPLAVLGVLTSAVSVYYYLRIPVLMYMRDPGDEPVRSETATGEWLVLGVCAAAVLFLGIFPNEGSLWVFGELHALDWARDSVRILFR